jgi:ABC-type branched-subunit amino acid transport system substrate-binding protein
MERILQKRYRVLRSLGRGGLGAVFLCDDLRLPGRQWALKQMNSPQPELFEKFRESFSREAGTLSQLKHPNLPDLVDYFEEGQDLFLVMEYVEGENLAEYVRRRGPLPESEAFRIGLTLLDILEYLHARRPPVIFRDLKPENVMVGTDGTIKLIDFGLARRFAPEKRHDTMPSGSVGYAAPEQWEDQAQTDARSDIYSWGATMAHLLSGKIPSPVFPLAALPKESGTVGSAARAILERCTRARAGDRYPSVEALAAEVRTLLSSCEGGEIAPGVASSSAVPPTTSPSGAPPRRRASDFGLAPTRRRPSAFRRAWRTVRLVWQAAPGASPPFLLLVAATVAWLAALGFALPRRPTPPAPRPDPARESGVAPYRQAFADPPRRELAKKLYREGRWTEAIALLDKLTTETPQDAEMQILAANAYIHLEKKPYVKLPFIGSDSGPDAFDSYAHLYGLALGQATINARGGIRGKKVVADVYDDRSQVARCLQIAQELVKDPEILAVLGPTNSQREIAIAPVFDVAHLSLVAPTASSEAVWEAGPYIFTASDSRAPRVRALARYEAGTHPRLAGVITERTSRLSNEMAESFVDEMRADGVKSVMLPPFEENQSDFSAQVAAVKEQGVDLVFFADYRPTSMAEFARQLRAAGDSARLCSQTIAFSRDLIDIGGAAVEGLVLCEYFHPQVETPAMRAFMAAFRRKFGDLTPPYAVANTFDAFLAVASAMESADTREGVRNYLASSGVTRPPFDGISGRFAFGRRLEARPLWLLEVHNGRFRILEQASQGSAH